MTFEQASSPMFIFGRHLWVFLTFLIQNRNDVMLVLADTPRLSYVVASVFVDSMNEKLIMNESKNALLLALVKP